MISAGADKLLKVWDVASALAQAASPTEGLDESVLKLKATAATAAHDKDINAIAVAPNDSLICTASQDRTAKVNTPGVHQLQSSRLNEWICSMLTGSNSACCLLEVLWVAALSGFYDGTNTQQPAFEVCT